MRALLYAILFASCSLYASEPAQVARWSSARINPARSIELDKKVALFLRSRERYRSIETMRKNGVPSTILFGLHYREADNSFSCSLAQGDPLTHRSRNVPRGRLPYKAPPYTWEECAIDAVYHVDRLDLSDWKRIGSGLEAIENYNGAGYRRRGIPSPYVWAGTSAYERGKYVSDGRFSPTAVDRQLGVAAILKRMQTRGITTPFDAPAKGSGVPRRSLD